MNDIAVNAEVDWPSHVETCGLCDVKFTLLVHFPPNEDILRSYPYRHESNPNSILCSRCYFALRKTEDT